MVYLSINSKIFQFLRYLRVVVFYYVIGMNETRSVKKIFEGKLEGRRGRG